MFTDYRSGFLLGFLGCIIILSCEKWDFDRTKFTQVITVGALEVGFNSAFLLGDIEGLRHAGVSETGFLLSTSVSSDQNLRADHAAVIKAISPPQRDSITTSDRAFAARASDLQSTSKYFFRAYIQLGNDEFAYGAIDTFTTSNLIISAPTFIRNSDECSGSVTITVNIQGASPSPENSLGIVWTSDESLMYPTVGSANVEEVMMLDANGSLRWDLTLVCNTIYFVRGFYQTKEAEIYGPVEAFTTDINGKWIPAGIFPEDFNRKKCAYSWSFSEQGIALVSNRSRSQSQLWKFDPSSLSWQLGATPPLHFSQSCFPQIAAENSILFFGELLDIWQYSIPNDGWIKTAFAEPGEGGEYAHINNFVFHYAEDYYWGTGLSLDPNIVYNSIWRQSLDNLFGERLSDFPGKARQLTSFFILDKKGYVGLGQDEKGQFFNDFWALEFASKTWFPIADFPKKITSTQSLTMNGKAYILTGYDVEGNPLPDFYEYDPETDQWTKLADFGHGDGNADIGFAIDGIIYGGLGISSSGEEKREMWRFVPELDPAQ